METETTNNDTAELSNSAERSPIPSRERGASSDDTPSFKTAKPSKEESIGNPPTPTSPFLNNEVESHELATDPNDVEGKAAPADKESILKNEGGENSEDQQHDHESNDKNQAGAASASGKKTSDSEQAASTAELKQGRDTEESGNQDEVSLGPEASKEDSNKDSQTSQEKDNSLIVEAERLQALDSLLAAADLLRQVSDKTLLNSQHELVLKMGKLMADTRDELLAPPDEASGWKKQSESHGQYDCSVFYKILANGICECRIDSPVESSLFVPFLAVLNESDLYETWIPSWKIPFKVGVSKSVKLRQKGRVNQLVQVQNDFGPFLPREVIMWGFGDDDTARSNGVCVKLRALQTTEEDESVPPLQDKVIRMDFDGGLLCQPCPADHPILTASTKAKEKKKKKKAPATQDGQEPEPKKLILISFTMTVDPKLNFIPRAFLNFCTRTVIGGVWKMMLHVAEEVRDGKRPEFTQLIEQKREEVYDWMEERARVLVDAVEEPSSEPAGTSQPKTVTV